MSVDHTHDKCQSVQTTVFCQPSDTFVPLCRKSYPYFVICQLNALLRDGRIKFARCPDGRPYAIIGNVVNGGEYLDTHLNFGIPSVVDESLFRSCIFGK